MDFWHFGGLKDFKISQKATCFTGYEFLYWRAISIEALDRGKKLYFESKDLW